MLNHNAFCELREHGDICCLDLSHLTRFIETESRNSRVPRLPKVRGSVAIVPMHGTLTKRGGFFSESTDRVIRTVQAAMGDKSIGGVVLDIDSPGGSSAGLKEFSDRLFDMRSESKPIVGVANTLAASAAFWSGSSVDQFVAAPSADVGGVGVWTLHIDQSKLLEDMGLDTTFVFAGRFKVEGNFFEPLSDEAREQLQMEVDEVHEDFLSALSRNRSVPKSVVKSGFGEGRVLSAKRALSAGMVDRIASLEEVVAGMESKPEGQSRRTDSQCERHLASVWKADTENVLPRGEYVESRRRRRQRERHRQKGY